MQTKLSKLPLALIFAILAVAPAPTPLANSTLEPGLFIGSIAIALVLAVYGLVTAKHFKRSKLLIASDVLVLALPILAWLWVIGFDNTFYSGGF